MGLGKSIVRGFGSEVGRSTARAVLNPLMKGKDSTSISVEEKAQSKAEATKRNKVINFEYAGSKQSTIESKVYQMIKYTIDQEEPTEDFVDLVQIVLGKVNEIGEFYEFKDWDMTKLEKITFEFTDFVNEFSRKNKGKIVSTQTEEEEVTIGDLLWSWVGIMIASCIFVGFEWNIAAAISSVLLGVNSLYIVYKVITKVVNIFK